MAKKRVLIVDDEVALLNILATRLKYAGFDVKTADSGEAALEAVQGFTPNLILLDIMMPGMDGFAVLGKFKENPKTRSIIIVMLTSKSDKQSIRRALSLGAIDYIVKPFTPNRLIEKVNKLMKTGKP